MLEILITTLLVGFLGMGTIFVVSASTRVLNASVKQAMINSNIQRVMGMISNDIRAGYKLQVPAAGKLVTTLPGGTTTEWTVENQKLYRKSGSGEKKEIIMYGGSDYTINVVYTPIIAKYYGVDIRINITLIGGNTFSVGTLDNTYYCKLDSSGYAI